MRRRLQGRSDVKALTAEHIILTSGRVVDPNQFVIEARPSQFVVKSRSGEHKIVNGVVKVYADGRQESHPRTYWHDQVVEEVLEGGGFTTPSSLWSTSSSHSSYSWDIGSWVIVVGIGMALVAAFFVFSWCYRVENKTQLIPTTPPSVIKTAVSTPMAASISVAAPTSAPPVQVASQVPIAPPASQASEISSGTPPETLSITREDQERSQREFERWIESQRRQESRNPPRETCSHENARWLQSRDHSHGYPCPFDLYCHDCGKVLDRKWR